MIFRTFVIVLWPLIYASFLFPLNIKNDRFSLNYIYIYILIDKILGYGLFVT